MVKQLYVSKAVAHFKEQLKKKYDLVDYHSQDEPAIFNGLYNAYDFNIIKNHRGKRIIVWCGNDSRQLYKRRYLKGVKELKNVTHIAKSHDIYNTLNKLGILSELIRICPTEIIKNKKPRGECVYFYGTKKHGSDFIPEIQKRIPYKIIHISTPTKYNKLELENIYEQCFIGVRLTAHDGLPNTVVELGLMGRRCVHNGELPNSIHWRNIEDVVRIIEEEYKIKNLDNEKIVEDVYNYMTVNDSWQKINPSEELEKSFNKKMATQASLSHCLRYFKSSFFNRYNLVDYNNQYEPAIFKGLYKKQDLDLISNHKGFKIILWSGSDALRLNTYWAKKDPSFIVKVKNLKNVRHIAISNFLQDSLLKQGIKSEHIPVASTYNVKNIYPRDNADKVYFYGTETHGSESIPELQKLIPFEIIQIPRCYNHSKEELNEIYKKCFVGVRLTKHDGLSNTVIELGLMGRRCIYNGALPNSIPWKTIQDAAESIKKEYERRMEDNSQIVEDVYNYLDINDDWRTIK